MGSTTGMSSGGTRRGTLVSVSLAGRTSKWTSMTDLPGCVARKGKLVSLPLTTKTTSTWAVSLPAVVCPH